MDHGSEKAEMVPVVEPVYQTGCVTLSICCELSLYGLHVVSQASVLRDILPGSQY